MFFLFGLITGFLFLKETLETKKYQRDYGRAIGKLVAHPFSAKKPQPKWQHQEEQSQALLKHSRMSSLSSTGNGIEAQEDRKIIPLAPPKYREVFSRQSNINLLTYSLLALHSVAYDQVLPIFMHYPPQANRSSNPNVRLPFKFTGGFGIDSGRIGLLFTIYGIVGMFIQFFVFPPLASRYGVLRCLKTVTALFPIVYILTPFTALFPTPLTQQIAVFCVMLLKCWAAIFAFPCTTILLTNSAVSLRVLGTLNGVATSVSALGRAAGPAIVGWTFSIGVDKGYAILPWWTLAAFAVLGAITPWWLVEMEGFGSGDASEGENVDSDGISDDEVERSDNIYVGGGPLADSGEGNDNVAIEEDLLHGQGQLSKRVSHTSEENCPPLKRMSSPLGMKDNVGPGGSDKLSNGLGQTRSGLGTGGTSYH